MLQKNGVSCFLVYPFLEVFIFTKKEKWVSRDGKFGFAIKSSQTNLLHTTCVAYVSPLTTETTQILKYSYSNFNQFQKFRIQPISYISSITNLYTSSIPKNLYVAWWTISYISSNPKWICYYLGPRKTCTWLDEHFRTFYPSLHESVTALESPLKKVAVCKWLLLTIWCPLNLSTL